MPAKPAAPAKTGGAKGSTEQNRSASGLCDNTLNYFITHTVMLCSRINLSFNFLLQLPGLSQLVTTWMVNLMWRKSVEEWLWRRYFCLDQVPVLFQCSHRGRELLILLLFVLPYKCFGHRVKMDTLEKICTCGNTRTSIIHTSVAVTPIICCACEAFNIIFKYIHHWVFIYFMTWV